MTTYKSIPQEVANEISDSPSLSGTTNLLMMNLHPITLFGKSTANIPKARLSVTWMAEQMATLLTVNGMTGWKCLGVRIVETSDDKILLVAFFKEL